MADAELDTNLNQGEAVGIPASRLFTNRLWQGRQAGFDTGPSRDLADSAAMHLEVGGELANGHAVGVSGQQFGSIRGTQTGLSLNRIFAHWAALIDDPGVPGDASTAPRPLDNAGNEGFQRLPGV
ncbi:MAG: hypothetical protein VB080_09430 [Propionicimonas sp.]|uniref:hypothetical protein n=1 Tax=Propionicimonas sp. TaxID=1955623 RepID=UPI002B1EC27C|nr:hypothetical protein [Propionicimonas sp.]MEA4944642.1 hypothetical protein [Propionicimonas sp.]MEA5117503.1 hypothetical protein [Propionicimonas sp.]